MHRFFAAALALGVLCAPTTSRAEGVNGFLAGVNGILTFPYDLVYDVIWPPSNFDELPGAPATAHVLGIVSGGLTGVGRLGWGLLDVTLTPFWVVPTQSPPARLELIPFYEVEYEL